MFWVIFTLSAVFRSVQEIGKWRVSYTWIPREWLEARNLLNLDLYHIVSVVHWVLAFSAGYLYHPPLFVKEIWVELPLLFFYYRLINDLFYHFLFIKPEFWG